MVIVGNAVVARVVITASSVIRFGRAQRPSGGGAFGEDHHSPSRFCQMASGSNGIHEQGSGREDPHPSYGMTA
jgi:hypothetical protein